MVRSHRLRLLVVSAGSVLALSSARADTEPGARAVIRGTGNDVQIVYRAPRAATAPPAAIDPVADALRQKRAGATDQTVLAYLDRRREEMPDILGADLLRRFRQAGAGDAVIAFLSTNAAVDIGMTAEDAAGVAGVPAPAGGWGGAYPDLVSSGYPFYGAYGGYGGFGGFGADRGRGMHRGFFKGGRDGFLLRFGNGFGRPHPHPLPAPRMGATTHAAVVGGRRR